MTIPLRQEFMRPVLKAFADGEARNQKQVEIIVAVALNFSKEDFEQFSLISSKTIIEERIEWALCNLYRAGFLVKAESGGFYKITSSGLNAVNKTLDLNAL
ncbi:MAG: winged helix-turn-helix domain-containing protein [Endomicrobiaceae bacterium]|nr:winged helix-turn-helix domain-containing protein [Endomicrobiaceae bacterium]